MPRALKPLSIPWYSMRVTLMFTLLLFAFSQTLPALWRQNVEVGLLGNLITFVVMAMVNCFGEWFFHRYTLHTAPIGWVKDFAAQHRRHHKLTSVKLERDGDVSVVRNSFPITQREQLKGAQFPWWALIAFWGLFTPPFLIVQLLMPWAPAMLMGYAGVTWTVWSYEVVHRIEHLPEDWWKRMFARPRLGGFWKKFYSFHLTHHANVKCNEAISGFFCLPIADWALGTYYEPETLLLAGEVVKDFKLPKEPRRFVRWLDKLTADREQRRI